MTIKNGVIREQFTAYDCEYYPEINNAEYLEYETKKTSLSEAICSYGYRHNGKWITIKKAKELSELGE